VPHIRIISNGLVQKPIVCLVAEYSEAELLRAARCEGVYELADPDQAKWIMVNPLDGHWSRAVESLLIDPVVTAWTQSRGT
jgi:hypothetical protein